jgi:two-component system sensor histidine kinase/response regulator
MSESTEVPVASVLIVDDNPDKRLALQAILASIGCPIVEAGSGREALRRVLVQPFAVILLDVRMPEMDGFETAALLRLRRESEATPIIFITAASRDEILHANRYVDGAVDFIFAPVAPEELRAKVSFFVGLYTKAAVLAGRARTVQKSADDLRLLTDAAPVGIFQTDLEDRYVQTNPRWTEITGVSAEDAVGRRWDIILDPEQRADSAPSSPQDRAQLQERRIQIRRPGLTPRIALLTSRFIPGPGGGRVGILADVTAEAEAEAALSEARDRANDASRLKSDFLANMSHEIRTPMNGVIGMTELLLETSLDSRQRDYAETVRDSCEALLVIINDILDFSRIEAGRIEVEHIEYEPQTVVEDVVDMLAQAAQTKGIELVGAVGADVPVVVSGDPGRVRQVLTNLIGNAMKFTQAGEIVVRVTSEDVSATEAQIRFEISDTGDGISDEKLASIFLPFVQADSSTSRKYGGTGLGLAISVQLVALMGGTCGASSQLGQGSTFWFTVRVGVNTDYGRNGRRVSDVALQGVAALVVDDNETQREVLSGFLTDLGMKVATVASGRAALAALTRAAARSRPFALVVVDRWMPGMDGLQLRDAILDDPTLDPRLVMMTGLGHEDELGPEGESGVSASLAKPVHRLHLQASVCLAMGLQPPDVIVLDPAPSWRASRPQPKRVAAPPKPAPSARRRPPKAALAGPGAAQSNAGRHILLAEDNPTNVKVAVAMLSGAGYQVDTVADGAQAVASVATRSYDAILMDCQMPTMSGYDATSLIRASQNGGLRVPIIAMTAGARREDEERCLAVGMDGYLSKPVSKAALLSMVARFVPVEAT